MTVTTVPQIWSSATISSVAEVVDCKHVTAKFVPTGVPLVSIGELGGRYINLDHAPRTTLEFFRLLSDGPRRLRAGDLVMSRNVSVGRVARVGEDQPSMAMGQDVVLLRPRTGGILPSFLQHLIRSPLVTRQLDGLMAGSTFKRVNVQEIKRLLVPLPDLNEQARIVDVLDDAEDAELAIQRTITKKQAIKQGIMQQLLTDRTRLPGFDANWTNVSLGNHVSYVQTVALSRAQLDATSPLKYLHYGDVHTRSSILLDADAEAMPRVAASLAGSAGRLQPGDLVFADASEDTEGVGKSVEMLQVPETGVIPGLHTIAARFDKSVLADGFKAYLQFIPSFREQLLRLVAGTKVLATTRAYISGITLSLPDISEQMAIAEVLSDVEEEIEGFRSRLHKAQDLKTGMMQQLLTGQTRLPVEVNP